MSEHTDGPWRAMPVEEWEAIKADQPSSICHVGEFVIVTENPSYEFHGTCEADATLIAAAPQMAEENERLRTALKSILELDGTNDLPDAWDIASKATGETDGK